MVHTAALTAQKLFNVEGWVCVVTGGGKYFLTRIKPQLYFKISSSRDVS
jgi:hypothetical protein